MPHPGAQGRTKVVVSFARNFRWQRSFSNYSGLFVLWVWGLNLGPCSRQKSSDGNSDLWGVWVDGGLAATQIREMGPGNWSQKWGSKMGPKNGPKNGVQKWDPKMGPKSGSLFKFNTNPVFESYFQGLF